MSSSYHVDPDITVASTLPSAFYRDAAAYDHVLERVFSAARPSPRAQRASTFLRAHAPALVAFALRVRVAERYSIEQILRILVERADKRGLWLRGSRRLALRQARRMLVHLTRLYAQGESPRLSL